ncbi:unnamed protein product, partial [Dibothriocephalus latus]
MDNGLSDPEEGEIPSDALEDDEDDVYDEDLYCGEEDRQRLLKMSEKEREEELYRRAERREAMQIRNAFKRKLKEQREKEKVDKGSRSSATSEKRPSESAKTKKPSTYADIYSSDSEDEESFLSDASLKVGLRDRKSAMAKQKELVKGCFARINIGLSQGVPVYRCGEIVDVVETPKTMVGGVSLPYFTQTYLNSLHLRTNKGIVLRVGKDQHTFRLAFVSNGEFLPAEFESWLRHTNEAGLRPPTLAYVNKKHAEIQKAINTIISDERVFEQIIQSKRRFQKAPTNFALRKAELLKQRELADEEGDTETVRRVNLELDELETQAEKIERKRTIGFKSITSINQRNRELSVKQAEEAIIKESQEAALSREDDPFTRIQSTPVIVTKSYLEKLRNKRV